MLYGFVIHSMSSGYYHVIAAKDRASATVIENVFTIDEKEDYDAAKATYEHDLYSTAFIRLIREVDPQRDFDEKGNYSKDGTYVEISNTVPYDTFLEH